VAVARGSLRGTTAERRWPAAVAVPTTRRTLRAGPKPWTQEAGRGLVSIATRRPLPGRVGEYRHTARVNGLIQVVLCSAHEDEKHDGRGNPD
jgi:hypothetical protein